MNRPYTAMIRRINSTVKQSLEKRPLSEYICIKINKVMEGRPHVVDSILNNEIDLVINTTEGTQSIKDSASIRQSALRNKIFCTTTMFGAFAIIDALHSSEDNWTYSTLQEINN